MKDSPNNQDRENQEVKSDIEVKKEQEREEQILDEISKMKFEDILNHEIDVNDIFKDL